MAKVFSDLDHSACCMVCRQVATIAWFEADSVVGVILSQFHWFLFYLTFFVYSSVCCSAKTLERNQAFGMVKLEFSCSFCGLLFANIWILRACLISQKILKLKPAL
ncbi:hypothetical protein Ancab_008005 [Ancistrocladus abbreviatus]